MIKINSDSKVYVICPEITETGGTELAHQLVDCLRKKKIAAFIVYVDDENYVNASIPEGFKQYSIHIADKPVDDAKNVLVCPETLFGFTSDFKNIQILFWWMSVDNFFSDSTLYSQLKFFGFDTTLRNVHGRIVRREKLFGSINLGTLKKNEKIILHLYQSHYAKTFLCANKLHPIMPLSDFINQNFINNSLLVLCKKENLILYNPKKGLKITRKIIAAMPSYTFIPLTGLKREELHDYIRRAKLYIDFGNHPGKDRLPREAAINRCCIITGKKGSAQYDEDVPIPDKYKFDKNEINSIVARIKEVLDDYEIHIQAFERYRQQILKEKKVFENEVDAIFIQKYGQDE